MADKGSAQGGAVANISLHTRVAVVTGGAGDIGSEIAGQLAAEGWQVWIFDIRDQVAGQTKARDITPAGHDIHYAQVDQRDPAAMTAALATLPGLDLMVITAATVTAQPFLDIDYEDWARHIDINLNGSFVASQCAAKHMAQGNVKGHIIFVSSWVASRPWPEITAYSTSKAGVDQLMRQVALELAPLGIRANAIAPGIVKAGLAKGQLENEPAYAARVAKAIPLGELQEASDIAQAVVFMASPGAATMTGSILTIDGGCSLGQVR
jgi:NAD(P)-dependent dehydrogenase (short-subunit alcohol dehydrogenase family)